MQLVNSKRSDMKFRDRYIMGRDAMNDRVNALCLQISSIQEDTSLQISRTKALTLMLLGRSPSQDEVPNPTG